MNSYKIRSTFNTETIVRASCMTKAIATYCADWQRSEDTIRSIELVS